MRRPGSNRRPRRSPLSPRHSGARAQRGSPESIIPARGYGFRARATQVGFSRLGYLLLMMPISGKPEIGGAPRNDTRMVSFKRATFRGSAQLAADHVLAALAIPEVERTRHGGTHAVRRHAGGAPAVRPRRHLLPIVGPLRHMGRVIELIELGGVLGHEAVRLDEVREHVIAGTVAPHAPFDVEAALLEAAGAAHQAVHVRHLVGHVVERRAVVAEDRDAVMVRAAAQELHHVRAVGKLEAEHVDEERHLLVGTRAVEHDVADLARPRAIEHRVRMLERVRRDAHRQPVGCDEAETVATAGRARERRRRSFDRDAIALGLGAERVDRGAVDGSEMHAEQRRLRPLANGEHVMLAAGRTEVDAVALGRHLLERPHLAVELNRFLNVAHAKLDAAYAGDAAVGHGHYLCLAWTGFRTNTQEVPAGGAQVPATPIIFEQCRS